MLTSHLLPPRTPALLTTALLLAAFLALTTGLRRDERARPAAPASAASPAAAAAPRLCVTPDLICPTATARAGDPCSCPHPLRGPVRRRVALVDAPAATAAPAPE